MAGFIRFRSLMNSVDILKLIVLFWNEYSIIIIMQMINVVVKN